jgi:D-apionolactonase
MTTIAQPVFPAYAPVTPLRAGPISLLFSDGDLRQLRVGGVEIVQRIYVAVRDHNWGTAPVTLHDLVIDDHGDHFRVTFTAVNRQNEIGFTWKGVIVGEADGTIHFSMDGRADTTFRRNRIGFCILHPASAAGAKATLTHSDGSRSASEFPTLVSPHQPFMDLRAITHEFAPGQEVEVSFEGDIFESEDQRNWTDASYKTYSTPLSIPYPVTVEAGTVIRQAVSIRLLNKEAAAASGTGTPPLTVTVGETLVGKLPALGLGSASHGQPLTENEIKQLRELKLHQLRIDLDLGRDDVAATLERATQEANALNAALEIALFVGEDAPAELAKLRDAFATAQPKVARWLLYARYADITPPELAASARPILSALAPSAPIGGGTNLYFVHINRTHPPVEALDFITYSINPQIHAFDLVSLVENMTAQPATVASTRAFSGDRSIVISPITLRARFNADASGPEAPPAPGELPDAVDARQPTGFAAAWTLGSLNNLAQAGVDSLTYYETTGWRGVMEVAQGSSLPAKFPSQPGMPFPVYHLFAALAPFARGDLLPVTISEPLSIAAISVVAGEQQCTIIGNLRDTAQRVAVVGVHGPFSMQTSGDPSGSIQFEQEQQPLWIDLAPYALVALQHPRTK